ncbi:MAG: SDR family NAD(P)-dependent oxidoreductase [Candidatus Latescibacterota bacterium]|nr:MAG: SDR family NAD(P)-dependent oxidoreductase [Candidatus Latescibacterota bacterium]
MNDSKKAIVVGATSGIGEALAIELANNGFEVGLTGRRQNLLDELDRRIQTRTYARKMDIRDAEAAPQILNELVREMNGADVIVINSGVLYRNGSWDELQAMINTNVTGFVAVAEAALEYFTNKGKGHLVGISSIAGLRGAKGSPVYNASKAFISNYMEGLRHKIATSGMPIHVTDIRPGFVRTQMIEGRPRLFWVSSPEKAARQIFSAIRNKKKRVYITRRWRLVAWLARIVPDWIYNKW